MNKLKSIVVALAGLGLAGIVTWSATAAEDADLEARKARILANLKVKFEQLQEMEVSITELKPSPFADLDEGTMQAGRQQQKFLVSKDDTKLFFVNGEAIDVSRSQEEIEVELARIADEKARQALERRKQLEDAIAGLPTRGNPEAPVLIVEFSDFQCPYCARGATTVEEVLKKYPEDVKFVFKHYPLNFHPWAKPAAIAAHCASQQDEEAFWSLHDVYFEKQKELNPENVLAKSKEFLGDTGVDLTTWTACAEDKESEAYKAAAAVVDADFALGQSLGVTGTPGFFINGRFLSGAQPVSAFDPLIAEAKTDPGL